MSELVNKLPTADEITPEWIDTIQEIIERTGMARARAAAGNRIELKSLSDNQWRSLVLEGTRPAFATAEDRDTVLAKINGPRVPLRAKLP